MSKNSLPYEILESARLVGFDVETMVKEETPKFFLNYNRIVGVKEVEGLILAGRELENGVMADFIVTSGKKIKTPVHLCFGVVEEEGTQEIVPRFIIDDGAQVLVLAHCSFPKARNLTHRMQAEIILGKNAIFLYEERHYHGEMGGAKVFPKFRVDVGDGSFFQSIFSLTKGSVGLLSIDVEVYAHTASRIEIVNKAYGRSSQDKVQIRDAVFLEGENARGLVKLRAAASQGGDVIMMGITEANAPYATGHVDCKEIVKGEGSTARAIPIVRVGDENARVTHEASVGKVNQKQLDTLMARGLTEQEAVDMIVQGML
ncbi:SufD family Fe-S cluster assembly protein [Candidatus Aerophobetes bacterium]|uniref:SufD family Fe-S cluster assembly protein n=1 Tax=Aerophobetes bacterium TaxID=2030807 RepID=A0A662DHV3_UNCAE|nr:MAG: SufD family Fe-S cluster assembly protein [Candidatus Aerophobetes bacterium]